MRLARLDDDVMCARALPVEYLVPDDPDYTGPDQFKRLATPLCPSPSNQHAGLS